MLTHPTLDKLIALKFTGMAAALADQMAMANSRELSFEERLGLLVDREAAERESRRLTSRLRRARLRHNAALEDIDWRSPRGLDRRLIQSLAACQWVKEHLNVLIAGPTGVGKTWLACALAHKACREGHTALYFRLAHLLRELTIAKGDGRYTKLLAASLEPTSSYSMIWDWPNRTPKTAATCSKCSKTDTAAAPPSPPANCPSTNGTPRSAIPHWPTPYSTG